MKPPIFRATFESDELIADNFAGGGGASNGIVEAIGRPVDVAINHDPIAIRMHELNHPETRHYCENIMEVDPVEACRGRRVGLAWFSPDCTHHSKARGRKPVDKNIRGLAWVVIHWARAVKPRIIMLENVEEFSDWGPVDADGYPIKEQAGETFQQWLAALIGCGYRVEYRELVAADYGTPTTRKRLFLIARSDGHPIVWPVPTHGAGRAFSWAPAASIIDWSLPAPSIFTRRKPLAEASLRRIATGIRRFVLESADPFIIPTTHQGDRRVHSIGDPLRTVTAAHRGEFALIEPFVIRHGHYSTRTGAGLRPIRGGPGTFRGQPLGAPLATVCATNDKHLVCPIITKHFGGTHANGTPKAFGSDARLPLGTVTCRQHNYLTAAWLMKYYGTNTGKDLRSPCPTVTADGNHFAAVAALLGRFDDDARPPVVRVDGEPYRIVDIGMRMLQPHELFAAQGFPSDYVIRFEHNGKPITKEAQIALAGNSVCREVARELVRANVRKAA